MDKKSTFNEKKTRVIICLWLVFNHKSVNQVYFKRGPVKDRGWNINCSGGSMDANVTEVDNGWTFLKVMDTGWSTTILLVPCAVVLTAGLLHVYSLVSGLLSKSCVRNKVLLVSDALSALGKECASIFHKGGARLILCGKSWEKLRELSDDLLDTSDPSLTFPPKLVLLDFGDTESLPEAISEIMECYGCLDVLILNSSMKLKAPAHTLSLEMDKLLMDNNYFGPVTLAKGVLPSMMSRRSGHLLVVNSIQGKLAVPFRTSCELTSVLTLPPSTQSRPSLTAFVLRWRSRASPSAPSTSPSSAHTRLGSRKTRRPSHSGHICTQRSRWAFLHARQPARWPKL
ncbi:dehydrogenase/reductase SDR family member 7C-B-like isoform X2 [Vanacampus margaritifer]